MKTQMKSVALFFSAALMVAGFSACSTGTDDNSCGLDQGDFLESFEGKNLTLAGPTSYGENCYEGYDENAKDNKGFKRFTKTETKHFIVEVNDGKHWETQEPTKELMNGGVAISNWNIRENTSTEQEADWWYSYKNQCSVYNTAVKGNKNAGHTGNNFLTVFNGFAVKAGLTFKDKQEYFVKSLWVCNSAYVAGVILNGNNSAAKFKDGDWFKLIVKGYVQGDAKAVAQDEIYLADFRDGKKLVMDQWTEFKLNNIAKEKVNRIKFEFDGSDKGEWGLNTPAYACIDDVKYRK